MSWAIKGGHIDAVEWLKMQNCPSSGVIACNEAAQKGDVKIMKILREKSPPCEWDLETVRIMVREGHYELFVWSQTHPSPAPWHDQMIIYTKHHADIQKWIIENKKSDYVNEISAKFQSVIEEPIEVVAFSLDDFF